MCNDVARAVAVLVLIMTSVAVVGMLPWILLALLLIFGAALLCCRLARLPFLFACESCHDVCG